jgi:hypothetical protein
MFATECLVMRKLYLYFILIYKRETFPEKCIYARTELYQKIYTGNMELRSL